MTESVLSGHIHHVCFFFFFFFFLGRLHCVWDLSSPTRIKPVPPTVEAWSLNHWTTREVPPSCRLRDLSYSFLSLHLFTLDSLFYHSGHSSGGGVAFHPLTIFLFLQFSRLLYVGEVLLNFTHAALFLQMSLTDRNWSRQIARAGMV